MQLVSSVLRQLLRLVLNQEVDRVRVWLDVLGVVGHAEVATCLLDGLVQ